MVHAFTSVCGGAAVRAAQSGNSGAGGAHSREKRDRQEKGARAILATARVRILVSTTV